MKEIAKETAMLQPSAYTDEPPRAQIHARRGKRTFLWPHHDKTRWLLVEASFCLDISPKVF